MKRAGTGKQTGRRWLSGGIAALLTAAVGLTLFWFPIGGGITRFSYDALFALRSNVAATNAVIVYMDEKSHTDLNQPFGAPWDRALHARLVEQLTAQGAKAIVFDILFTEPSTDPSADEHFEKAIKQSGRVILGSNYQVRETTPGLVGRWEEVPYEPFLNAAIAWGNVDLIPDPDYGIRRFFPTLNDISGFASIPWLPAVVAKVAGVPDSFTGSDRSEPRWLNYYGPPGTIPNVSYFVALETNGVAPISFKDKLVFVGGKLAADFSGKGKDEFRTPYSYWISKETGGFAPGVEIHATAALNLVQGNWLTRFPEKLELALVLVVAALAGFGLMRFQPLTAVLLALATSFATAVGAHLLAWHGFVWFAWIIPVVEIGVATLCSISINSVQLYVEKRLREQERIAYEALVAELNKAADYVRSLLPARLSGEVETDWCFHPCEQLGGDAFGYHWIDADHLAVYLLDVCGHGVGAALLSVSVLNALRAQTLPGVDFLEPAAVLMGLNRTFRMDNQNNLYFTAWYGVYHRSRRELIYASGGHPPAILVGPTAQGPASLAVLRTEGPAIGCLDEMVYPSAVHPVMLGSRLLVFSDGVFEIFQENEKTGTWDEFLASLKEAQIQTLRPEERLKNAKRIRGRDLLEDDFSLVELRFN
jgi:sigma-B regulation protein RsbU (phosphoserine phosphatase)